MCGGGLVPDVMHDILEGALQYEVKLMLRSFVQMECYFTLETINLRLVSFELGYMESRDRPTPISDNTISSTGHSLKQNGMCLDICLHIANEVLLIKLHRCGF